MSNLKDAEEYLEDIKEKYNIGTAWQVTKPYLIEAIKQAQTDSWNEAIDKAAESARLGNTENGVYNVLEVSKQSILKLKL